MRGACDANDVIAGFLSMPLARQLLFLSLYASEITVLARGYFVDGDVGMAQKCNESLHRIMGYLSRLIRDQVPASDRGFAEMLFQGAQKKGWTDILIRSLKACTTASTEP